MTDARYKLYSLDNKFIEEVDFVPSDFTGHVEWYSGTKEWLEDGAYHRLDGPAFMRNNGEKEWWIDGKYIECKTDEEFKLLVGIMKLKRLL